MLVDLRAKKITGRQAQEVLEEANIVTNMNRIPFDPLGANVTSGIRLGTSAVTTRGLGKAEMEEVADILDSVLSHMDDHKTLEAARRRVRELCLRFPLYLDRWEMAASAR